MIVGILAVCIVCDRISPALTSLNLSVQSSQCFCIMCKSRTLEGTRSMDKQDLRTSEVMRAPKDSGQAVTQLVCFCFCNPPPGPTNHMPHIFDSGDIK